MASTEIHGSARIQIHEGKLEEYKRLAARCLEIVRTREPGTLEYDLFITRDGTECFMHERYRDSEAGLAHLANMGEVREALSSVCTIAGEVCGSPSAPLRKALEKAGVKIYAPLSLLDR